MTIKRLLFLQIMVALGLGLVAFLPKVANSTPQGIDLKLPTDVGKWYGEDQKITERELLTLAQDTSFARKVYTDGLGNQIFASIVLSGRDLDNSIHRPERCLPAQGWTVVDSKVVPIPVPNVSATPLGVTRLHNTRQVETNAGGTIPIYNLTYYWFIGWNISTPSHFERTYIDIRDRVLYGYNQRWAYITIASTITEGVIKFGKNEKETDVMLQEFIQQLLPLVKKEPETTAAEVPAQSSGNPG